MKKFKSPVNFALTLASLLPLFIAAAVMDISLVTPIICLAALLFLHFVFNRRSTGDAPNAEFVKAKAEAYNRLDNANPNILISGGPQSQASFAIVQTAVQTDETYHGAWLCWGAVIISYFVGIIPMYDKIFPAPLADDLLFYYMGTPTGNLFPFYPFFNGIILMAAGDLSCHFLAKKNPKAARVLLTIFSLAGAGMFCYALTNLMKY